MFPLVLLQAKAVRQINIIAPSGVQFYVSISSPSGEGGEIWDTVMVWVYLTKFPLVLLQAKAVSFALVRAEEEPNRFH